MLTKSIPLWTVDLAAIDRIARDWGTYIDFQRISSSTRWIYVGNNCKVEVNGIGTLNWNWQMTYLIPTWHFFAPYIRWNLVSVLVFLDLGFNLNFHDLVVELYLGTTYYGFGFVLDGFMALNIDNYVLSNTNDSYYLLMTIFGNTCDNVIIWHAGLGHIRQKRTNRLARENLLGYSLKLICQLVNIV